MFFRILAQIGYTIFVILETLLTLRFIFVFIGVPAKAPIIVWLYTFTDKVISPFIGIFPQNSVSILGFSLELTTLLVIFIITICSYALNEIIKAYSS